MIGFGFCETVLFCSDLRFRHIRAFKSHFFGPRGKAFPPETGFGIHCLLLRSCEDAFPGSSVYDCRFVPCMPQILYFEGYTRAY